ncbi:MAG TPA: cellulose synthase complex periplasmic endoglucanase BcsZ [Limnobacter sp.]|uniref:cellulose synthase complex periplasmic endoglucanase BcsZ n=1 Tax=Limnobacter sp. TaxID=2003368 RepID=UPI002E34A7F5|nr:cellulose synthase complex periplasmic endoglucanase BcsZ [Limnobacter sp.]HEX5484459.1 cellulose synthase complex periplasmic endoglucanase BcsZ [Limnobacter sp.]
MKGWRIVFGMLAMGVALATTAPSARAGVMETIESLFGAHSDWPDWAHFKRAYLSEDGRVVDHSESDLRTVSEGQAYALFFALAANDKDSFKRILTWTQNNLAAGDLRKNLPAWIWGKSDKGWAVIDSNSASDADLWMVFTLDQAGRLWCKPEYTATAKAMGMNLLNRETQVVTGLGLSLLPGEKGFSNSSGDVRLNPSYAPAFILGYLAQSQAEEPRWAELYLSNQRLLMQMASHGSFADWVTLKNGELGPAEDGRGDYDAIRVYLWLGMDGGSDPMEKSLIQQIKPFTREIAKRGAVPLWTNPWQGKVSEDNGPAGFQVAAAPLMIKLGDKTLARQLESKGLTSDSSKAWLDYGYYNSVLTLFARGNLQQRYSVSSQHGMQPRTWKGGHCG